MGVDRIYMDIKKWAVVIAILVLLPLFLGLFVDAIYLAPQYEDYCTNNRYAQPMLAKEVPSTNCPDLYQTPEAQSCTKDKGYVQEKYDANNCSVFDKCEMCDANFQVAQSTYNRNIFLILAPLGLIIIIIGMYLAVEYIGAGLMFGGIITLFYATVRYFSDMSKLLRAIIILVELLIIIFIAYRKIENNKSGVNSSNKKQRRSKK